MAETTGKGDNENTPMTQADIEALLAGRGKAGGASEKKSGSVDPDDDGSSILSPDEIDKLFQSPAKKTGKPLEAEASIVDDGASILSPDEIDSFFNKSPKSPEKDLAKESEPDDEGSSILSPDEIDKLFQSPAKKTGKPLEAEDSIVDDGASILSPDEIDSFFNKSPKSPEKDLAKEPDDDGSSILSPDEIERLLHSTREKSSALSDEPSPKEEKKINILSADDIDALFNTVPIDKIISPTPGVRDTSLDDDLVLMRPDDIERLMNSRSDRSSDSEERVSIPPGKAEKIDVDDILNEDDIDSLFKSTPEQETLLPEPLNDDGLVSVSQDDIDQLLKNALGDTEMSSALGDDDGVGNSSNLISEDDIDDLLSHTLDSDEDIGLVTQDDIDSLLQGALDKTISSSDPEKQEPEKENNPPIEKSIDTLVEVEESSPQSMIEEKEEDEEEQPSLFITQDTIDTLLKEAERPEQAFDLPASAVPEDSMDPLFGGEKGDEAIIQEIESLPDVDPDIDGLVSQDEIDSLLSGTDDEGEKRTLKEDDVPGLISQNDVNELLSKAEQTPEAEEDEPSLISQDDIDQLLAIEVSDEQTPSEAEKGQSNETGEVSQDVIDKLLEEETVEDKDDGGLVTQDIIDQLLNEEVEEEEPVKKAEKDQVILEEVKEEAETSVTEKGPSWYRSKVLWSAVAGVLTLVVSIVTIVTMKPPLTGHGEAPQILHFTIVPESAPSAHEPVEPVTEKMVMVSRDFNGFVVMAPSGRKDIVYVQADLTVDLSEESANQVSQYEPYFRNVIYDVLAEAMKNQDRLTMKQSELQDSIKLALNNALTSKSIEKVVFTRFALI